MSYKILVVDSDEAVLWVVSKFLAINGYIGVRAKNGEEAMDLLVKEKPDLMVLDTSIPGIGGIGVVKELKERAIDIPVIMMSGYDGSSDALSEYELMGYKEILLKPESLYSLLDKINRALEAK